jgi:hypothetical protein
LVSATTVYDACIRADAKSAFASTSSRQPFQVVRVGRVCSDRPVGWCRRLGSTARCQGPPCTMTMFASGRMQHLHRLSRHHVNHLRSNKLSHVRSDRRVGSTWAESSRRLLSPARCQRQQCTMRPDAKSASTRTSSRQSFQVVQVGLCRLPSSRLVLTPRVHGSVSAITMYDCIRADAESTSTRTSSRQSFQVVQVRLCRLRSSRLVSSARVLGVSNHHVRCLHPGECKICLLMRCTGTQTLEA